MNVFFVFLELDSEPVDATKNVRTAEVLVPNTCEQESSQPSGKSRPRLHFYTVKKAPEFINFTDIYWPDQLFLRFCF